jgi:hypothetical protein
MPKCPFDGCKKKLALTDTTCKCGKVFCGTHRHAESHVCQYDYKGEGKELLLKTMSSAVVAKKIETL